MAAVGMTWPGEAAAQDRDARFEQIVRTYGGRVRALVHRMVGSDADDLVQDIFLQVYRALPEFRGDASVATWLYRIATNRCLDHLRRHRRTQARVISLDERTQESAPDLAAAAASPEATTEARDLSREVRRCLLALPVELRTVVVLRDLEGLEYREIAAVLGLPLGTVQSRLHRARNLLKEKLSPYLEG
ncbi:MAG TPA: sigma-70 family RNA polymerase sigma factor [Firmicutes bacterium]|nr:sigma-70 family RNA polymerase sigma factor [Bacillota bacterium]